MQQSRRLLACAYENAEAFNKHWATELREAGAGLVEGAGIGDARAVLDLGAGIGLNLPTIRRAAPGAFVVGADLVETMIAAAPREYARVLMDASALGFGDASFDAVVMAFMLFHVPEQQRALAEARRVLRPGGRLAVGAWYVGTEDMVAERIWVDLLDELSAARPDASISNQDTMSTPERITELLEGNGFRDVETAIRRVDDPTDLEGFLERRTQLGMSRTRFESLAPDVRARCVALARERLGALTPDDFIAREAPLYAWARRA
jgi:SAM-dependent methyltransferase